MLSKMNYFKSNKYFTPFFFFKLSANTATKLGVLYENICLANAL